MYNQEIQPVFSTICLDALEPSWRAGITANAVHSAPMDWPRALHNMIGRVGDYWASFTDRGLQPPYEYAVIWGAFLEAYGIPKIDCVLAAWAYAQSDKIDWHQAATQWLANSLTEQDQSLAILLKDHPTETLYYLLHESGDEETLH